MALNSGDQLGRYQVLRQLGAGAMGEVYLAEDPQIGRQLAIKTVRLVTEGAHDIKDLQARLVREARAAGRLVHPHVVTLFDAGESDGVFYLAFEFVDGVDLSQRLRGAPPLTVAETLRIGRQVAEGLDAAHQVGIVHRDIKPANILLDARGQVKISDFGIAKMVGQQTELTQTGSVVGSPHYLSPEQVRGEELDGRSDLFSLGVVLYEMLTRLRPFEGETITTLVYQILSRDPTPLEQARPQLPPNLGVVVSKLLAKNAEERFANGREVADALAECERELPAQLLGAPAAGTMAEIAARRDTAARVPKPPSSAAGVPAVPSASTNPTEMDTAATSLLSSKDTAVVSDGLPPLPAVPVAPKTPDGASETPAETPQSVVPAARSRVRLALGGGLVVLVAALVTFAVWRGTEAPERPDLPVSEMAVEDEPGAIEDVRETVADEGEETTEVREPESTPEWEETPSPTSAVAGTETEDQAPPVAAAVGEGVAPEKQSPEVVLESSAAATTRQNDGEEPPTLNQESPSAADSELSTTPAVRQTDEASVESDSVVTKDPVIESAPVPEPAPVESLPVEKTVSTSLSLKFDVTPEDTFVLLKEVGERRFTSIGRAREWSGKKKTRVYDLPGPGEYYLRFRSQGRREVTYRLIATHGAGATPIVLRMQ